MNNQSLYTLLAIAGAAPFLACAVLPLTGTDSISPFGPLDRLAGIYGLAIISFLAGAHWATELYAQNRTTLNLFVLSNAILLIAGGALITAGIKVALLAQVAAFATLLWIDFRLLGSGTLTRDYFRIRGVVTTLVIASLATIVLTP